MKIEIDWLQQYVDPGLPLEELGRLLTMAGLEVEAQERVPLSGGGAADVLELNVTPNRGYCLSHIGVAREVAALTGQPLALPDPERDLEQTPRGPDLATRLHVANEAPDLCPRYAALVIEGVRVGPSPPWLCNRLTALGLRPINNVVDITNFVLMEYGQPLHAFDLHRLQENRIVIRRAKKEEPFTALDGTALKLNPDALVIADAHRPVALAGIMGGGNSQVTESTTVVALESACFDPAAVSKTSRRYGLRSDSSFRFERGVDIDGVITAQSRAALLIQELAGGTLLADRIDHYPKPQPPVRVALRVSRCNQILGTSLTAAVITGHLQALGCSLEVDSPDERYLVTVPPHRPLLHREVDLIEELARLHGFEKIKVSDPLARLTPVHLTPLQKIIREAKECLRGVGFLETINYSFQEEEYAQSFLQAFFGREAKTLRLDNPISMDLGTLRPSLLPGLIKTAVRNINRGQKSLRLFEQGHTFVQLPKQGRAERSSLAVLVTGPLPPDVWKPSGKEYDFFDIKGVLETLLERFDMALDFRPAAKPFLTAEASLEGFTGSRSVVSLGQIDPRTAKNMGLEQPAFALEMNLEALVEALPETTRFAPLPRFPGIYRDLSLLVDTPVSSGQVRDVIQKSGAPWLTQVDLYDLFAGKKLPQGKKSLTFALTFQCPDRTLTDREIIPVVDRIIENLGQTLGASLRDQPSANPSTAR